MNPAARAEHLQRPRLPTATLDAPRSSLVLLLLATLQPLAVAAQSSWVSDPAVQRQLAAGEAVVATTSAIDPGHPRGRIRAAVRIQASPEAIWAVMTDCQQAPAYVPGLKRCRRIDGAPDGSWQDIEHEVRLSWLLPTVRYVLHCQLDPPRRIDFSRISGDLKEEEGTWLLSPTADGTATVVGYEVYVDPGFWIPQALVVRSLRKDLPAALTGLRHRVESAAGADSTSGGHASR